MVGVAPLHPCPSCARHVRTSEPTCPFCASALSLAGVPPRAVPTQRLGRAATWAFATLVASGGACSAQSHELDGGPRDAALDDTSFDACLVHPEIYACWGPDAGYGGPAYDASWRWPDAGVDAAGDAAVADADANGSPDR